MHFISLQKETNTIVAVCSLTNITLGSFQACNLGYCVSKCYEGQGVMTELCHHAIKYTFETVGLNRIMANYMKKNRRSERLLYKLGFKKEGVAEKYLLINGQWEDHVLTSLINPKRASL